MEQKNNNQTKEVLMQQIQQSMPSNATYNNTIIAYEPIWAIGTGSTPSLVEINSIHSFIKNEILNYKEFKILYGGSVNSKNSAEILI